MVLVGAAGNKAFEPICRQSYALQFPAARELGWRQTCARIEAQIERVREDAYTACASPPSLAGCTTGQVMSSGRNANQASPSSLRMIFV